MGTGEYKAMESQWDAREEALRIQIEKKQREERELDNQLLIARTRKDCHDKWESAVAQRLPLKEMIISYFKKERTDSTFSIRFCKKVGKLLKQLIKEDEKLKSNDANKLKYQGGHTLIRVYNEICDINGEICDGQETQDQAMKWKANNWKSAAKAAGEEKMRLFAERNLTLVTRILNPNSKVAPFKCFCSPEQGDTPEQLNKFRDNHPVPATFETYPKREEAWQKQKRHAATLGRKTG